LLLLDFLLLPDFLVLNLNLSGLFLEEPFEFRLFLLDFLILTLNLSGLLLEDLFEFRKQAWLLLILDCASRASRACRGRASLSLDPC